MILFQDYVGIHQLDQVYLARTGDDAFQESSSQIGDVYQVSLWPTDDAYPVSPLQTDYACPAYL